MHPSTSTRALQYLELKTTLPCRMLFKLDRNSMAWGIEGRSPFMDHELAQLAFRMPEAQTVDSRGGKRVLKDILRRDLGSKYVYRRKKGFGNPLNYWFTGSASAELLSTARDPDAFALSVPQLRSRGRPNLRNQNGLRRSRTSIAVAPRGIGPIPRTNAHIGGRMSTQCVTACRHSLLAIRRGGVRPSLSPSSSPRSA